MKPFFVYLLKCSDGSYYGGQTDDMAVRMHQHHAGEIGYTSTRKPVELVWQGEFETREGAIAFEQQIKGWSRAKKEALIRGDWKAVQRHAWGTNNPLPAHLAGDGSSIPQGERDERSQGERAQVADEIGVQGDPPANASLPVRPEVSKGSSVSADKAPFNLLQNVLGDKPELQRRAIAKAITLLESTRTDHRAQGDELLTALLPHTGKSFRLGISGVPGVGKSTFIEVLGLYLIAQGHRVAVLTIDPSSSVSGGSILGDKTRMEKLSVHERAYIRPSPSSGNLGGVAEKTREAMLVCEAAGYDVVIVETVGVGQSETAVADMTDMFVLMQLPNAGDDLQAIKKGVMELADLVIINKADIDADAAMRAEAQITSAMRLFGLVNNAMDGAQAASYDKNWHPQVVQLSALHNKGVDVFWKAVTQFKTLQTANGQLAARRQQQSLSWMWERIDAGLKQAFRQNPQVRERLPGLMAEVARGEVAASTAARSLLALASKGWNA
ncbi:methylmalonyl Co-A mutase-associated GTPase MeaB [Polaromonas sp. SP1]|nr:methylmalonyl Co-A mutase-associated GTPase MeaB [Polaromonas sp. SP1]QGJ18888.1 methylmalonyl Co-A mutase-associated GTPase MeaB [Polaromonas sp. Pch-P]